jgi:hypothetical protein
MASRSGHRLADGKLLPKTLGFLKFAVDNTGLLMEAARVGKRFCVHRMTPPEY